MTPLFSLSLRTTHGTVEILDSASQALGRQEVSALQSQSFDFFATIQEYLRVRGWSDEHLHISLRLEIGTLSGESEQE